MNSDTTSWFTISNWSLMWLAASCHRARLLFSSQQINEENMSLYIQLRMPMKTHVQQNWHFKLQYFNFVYHILQHSLSVFSFRTERETSHFPCIPFTYTFANHLLPRLLHHLIYPSMSLSWLFANYWWPYNFQSKFTSFSLPVRVTWNSRHKVGACILVDYCSSWTSD